MIYFLRSEQDTDLLQAGWIKVGTTTRLTARLKQIAAEIDHMPTVLAVLDGGFAEEQALHRKFGFVRRLGEWFHPDPELLRLIETDGRPWDGDAPTKIVRIETELATQARYVAAKQGMTVTKLLNDWLRPIINAEFRKAGEDILEGEK